jgi:hypothetical protein
MNNAKRRMIGSGIPINHNASTKAHDGLHKLVALCK